MRLIGTLNNENEAKRFVNYLTSLGVGSSCEVSFDPATNHMSYQVWIHEEDKIGGAAADFEEFIRSPSDPKFNAPILEPEPQEFAEERELPEEPEPYKYKTYFTISILFLCALLFFLNSLQEIPLAKEGVSETVFTPTPLQADLLYDWPSSWKGFYGRVMESTGEGPLFEQIRQGEVWRLFSPVFLHADLLHILFNMLWLWYLGRPIEQRIGPVRTFLLSAIAAAGSNTAQYLMTGPLFMGYSGVVMALAAFIWTRERKAPWEGYPLNKSTILFLLFFIGAIFLIQIASFFVQMFTTYKFAPNIANTAHITGALIGAYLGRFSFFAQRVKK